MSQFMITMMFFIMLTLFVSMPRVSSGNFTDSKNDPSAPNLPNTEIEETENINFLKAKIAQLEKDNNEIAKERNELAAENIILLEQNELIYPYVKNMRPHVQKEFLKEVRQMNDPQKFLKIVPKVPVLYSVPIVSFSTTSTSGGKPKYEHPGIPIYIEPQYENKTKQQIYVVEYIFCSSNPAYVSRFEDVLVLKLGKLTFCDPKWRIWEDSRRQIQTRIQHENGTFGDDYRLTQFERMRLAGLIYRRGERYRKIYSNLKTYYKKFKNTELENFYDHLQSTIKNLSLAHL